MKYETTTTRRMRRDATRHNFRNASFESGVIGWVMAGRKRWGWEAKVSLVCGQALRSKVTINPLSAVDSYSASSEMSAWITYIWVTCKSRFGGEREREKKEGKIIRYFVVPIRSLTNVRINKSITNKSIYRLL